jgi:hypothetical protein
MVDRYGVEFKSAGVSELERLHEIEKQYRRLQMEHDLPMSAPRRNRVARSF